MTELLDLPELLSAPKCNTFAMKGGQVGAPWRPPYVCLSPPLRWKVKTGKLNLHHPQQRIKMEQSDCGMVRHVKMANIVQLIN